MMCFFHLFKKNILFKTFHILQTKQTVILNVPYLLCQLNKRSNRVTEVDLYSIVITYAAQHLVICSHGHRVAAAQSALYFRS